MSDCEYQIGSVFSGAIPASVLGCNSHCHWYQIHSQAPDSTVKIGIIPEGQNCRFRVYCVQIDQKSNMSHFFDKIGLY